MILVSSCLICRLDGQPASCDTFDIFPDADFSGNDLPGFISTNSRYDCCTACTANSQCNVFTFEPCSGLGCTGRCYLKSAAGPKSDANGFVSGKKGSSPGTPTAPSAPGSISGGSIFLIIFFIPLGLYFIGGVGYNFHKGERGTEMVPQLEYWLLFFALIVDGFQFAVLRVKQLLRLEPSY